MVELSQSLKSSSTVHLDHTKRADRMSSSRDLSDYERAMNNETRGVAAVFETNLSFVSRFSLLVPIRLIVRGLRVVKQEKLPM